MVALELAGIPFEIDLPPGGLSTALAERYRGFSGLAAQPKVSVQVRFDPALPPRASPVRPSVEGESCLTIRGENFWALFDRPSRSLSIVQPEALFPLELVIQQAAAQLLLDPDRPGLLLHAACLAGPKGAAAFVGPSGAGKTTVATLAEPPLEILADEIAPVTREEGGWVAWGTPLNRGIPGRSPLRALCLLGRAEENHWVEETPARVLRTVLANAVAPADDQAALRRFAEHAAALVAKVLCLRFDFAPGPKAREALQRAAERGWEMG